MLLTYARPADCALPMLNCADRLAALNALTNVLVKVLLAVLLPTLVALLRVLFAIVFLIPTDYALQRVIGPDSALACRTYYVLLLAAANLPTGLAGPGMFLADRLSTRAAAKSMFFAYRF